MFQLTIRFQEASGRVVEQTTAHATMASARRRFDAARVSLTRRHATVLEYEIEPLDGGPVSDADAIQQWEDQS